MQPPDVQEDDRTRGFLAAICIVIALLFTLAGTSAVLAAFSPGNPGDDRYGEALRELDQTLIELEHLDESTSRTAVPDAREKVSAAVGRVRKAGDPDTEDLAAAHEDLERAFAAVPDGTPASETAGAIRGEVAALRAAWHRCFTHRG